MTEDSLITKITDIIIEQTVNKKIPTVVFMSIKKEDLVKNIFWTLKSGNKNESTFSQDDWNQVAEIMQNLAEIPLLLKETSDINDIKTETENFIKEINKGKGVVIINAESVQANQFLSKDNISVIIV